MNDIKITSETNVKNEVKGEFGHGKRYKNSRNKENKDRELVQ